jgi:hypothetical protein
MNAAIEVKKFKEYTGLHALVAVFLILFIFCLDEGSFSFEWMNSWGYWVTFCIYVLGIFAGQILTQYFIFRSLNVAHRIVLSILVGGTIGFFVVASMFTLLLIISQTT